MMSEQPPPRILLIEDNPADTDLISETLQSVNLGGALRTCESLNAGLADLAREGADLVLLDLSLPDSTGLETFTKARQSAPDVPIIILTGWADTQMGLQAVRSGAQDYLPKGELAGALLHRSIHYALERFRIQQALQASEQNYREVFDALRESEQRFAAFMVHLPAAAFIKDETGRTVYANRYLQELFGWQEWQGKSTEELVRGQLGVQMAEDDRKALAEGPLKVLETMPDREGISRTFETIKFPIHLEGKGRLLGGIALDITDLRQKEVRLEEQINELHRWQAATLGREMRVLELKREVNQLLAAAGQPARYPSVAEST